MDLTLLTVIALVGLALLFDYTNGFHDSANSVATIVATKVLRPRIAVLWAAGFNFIAFAVFGTKVADTIGSVVKPGTVGLAVVFAALFGALVWNFITWYVGLPSSSSHALIGGLAGAGLAAAGTSGISFAPIQKALLFMVLSPLVGLALSGVIMLLVRAAIRATGASTRQSDRTFRGLQLVSSAAISLGHGANDAQKTMGVITVLLISTGHLPAPGGDLAVPLWVVLACHTSIALGTLSGGWKIVQTLGTRITHLRPASGFSAETAAAIALFGSTAMGAPVSTTHTVAGTVTGVGIADREAVSWRVFGRMVGAWVITIPAAAGVAALMYAITQIPSTAVAATIITIIGVVCAGLLVLARRDNLGPGDLDTAPERDERAAQPVGAGS